jgi:hypothetical protein
MRGRGNRASPRERPLSAAIPNRSPIQPLDVLSPRVIYFSWSFHRAVVVHADKLVVLPIRNDAAHSASRIFNIANTPGDDVKVCVQDRLPGACTVIGSEVETGD